MNGGGKGEVEGGGEERTPRALSLQLPLGLRGEEERVMTRPELERSPVLGGAVSFIDCDL